MTAFNACNVHVSNMIKSEPRINGSDTSGLVRVSENAMPVDVLHKNPAQNVHLRICICGF